ncbi:MATE family efflux transporter [uncultured Odoribacter sp.]|uniref:MATE family efflux transporter n=1 Tax=uncultured Odoribacter sp. TaxID=876416 RepID=UPI002610388A|nr:MATE family efflux transporter [uncultured Odoribacter sp.]
MEKAIQNIKELEEMNIKRLLWKYFLPAFTGVVVNALYNIVDRIFIGRGVDALALSGLSAVFPLMLIIFAFGMLVAIGANVRISINMGKKDYKRAERVLGNAVTLGIIISALLTLFGYIYRYPLLKMFGAGEGALPYALEYFKYILFANVFATIGFILNNACRAEGNPKTAMYSLFISAGTNTVLDPIFIFGLGMGVKGAAIATIISQFVLCIWVVAHFYSKRSALKLHFANLRLNGQIIYYILTIGFAPFSMQLAASAVQAVLNTQLIRYGGELAVGAMGIINSVAQLLVMSIIAINMASQPIIGFNFGAKQYKRVRDTLITCIWAASLIAVGGFLITQLFPGAIVRIFNNDNPELFELGRKGLQIFTLFFPIVGFQIITGNYYQSIGKAGIAAFLSLLRQVIILIPMLYILPPFTQLWGVWFANPLSDLLAGIISALFLIRALKKLKMSI